MFEDTNNTEQALRQGRSGAKVMMIFMSVLCAGLSVNVWTSLPPDQVTSAKVAVIFVILPLCALSTIAVSLCALCANTRLLRRTPAPHSPRLLVRQQNLLVKQ